MDVTVLTTFLKLLVQIVCHKIKLYLPLFMGGVGEVSNYFGFRAPISTSGETLCYLLEYCKNIRPNCGFPCSLKIFKK